MTSGVVWNCNSLLAHSRLAQLQLLTSPSSLTRPLFIALPATNLAPAAEVPTLLGYTPFSSPATRTANGGLSGGVLLYMRANVPCSAAPDIDGGAANIIFVRVQLPGIGLTLLGVCYRRPSPPASSLPPITSACSRALDTHMPVVLCGDFNAHYSSWSRAATSTAGQRLRDYCDNSGLAVLNVLFCRHEPTMHGAHAATVDLVLSSHPDHFSSLSCDPV